MHKKAPPRGRRRRIQRALLFLLAGLVGDAAAGLAGRLAGGLALAAAAVLDAGAEIAGLKGLDPLHKNNSNHKCKARIYIYID